MMKSLLLATLFGITLFFAVPAFAHPHGPLPLGGHDTVTIPLGQMTGLEKTTLSFYASEDNALPWGFIEGKISNHVPGHPVIIQVFAQDRPAHFAQTDVNEDGTYQYKFRVASTDGDGTVRSFLGDYTVIIYKVVHLGPAYDAA